METPYACIATPLKRNFSIIEGVVWSQTKRSSSTAKRARCLRFGGRLEHMIQLSKYTAYWPWRRRDMYFGGQESHRLLWCSNALQVPCNLVPCYKSVFCACATCVVHIIDDFDRSDLCHPWLTVEGTNRRFDPVCVCVCVCVCVFKGSEPVMKRRALVPPKIQFITH